VTTGSVILNDTYIHLKDDPQLYLKVQASNLSESTEGPEESSLRTGGNTRRSTGKGAVYRLDVTLDHVDPEDKETLRSWIGPTLIIRDTRGRVWEGGIVGKSLAISEHGATDTSDISFQFVNTDSQYTIVGE
jgi:hypothetical protein